MLDLMTRATIFQRADRQPAGEIYIDSALLLTTSVLTGSPKTVQVARLYSDPEPRRTVPQIAERR